jgi:ubiquinone biosynthesis protein
MVGKITREQRFAFAGVFVSLAQNDGKGMATSLRKLAIDSDIEVLDALGDDLNEMIDQLITLDVDDSGMAEFTVRLQKIIYKYNLKLPGNVFLILRSLAILEGIGKLMYPDLDTLAAVKPYGRKLLAEQFSLDNIGFETSNILSQVSSLFYQIPTEAKLILRKLRRGELNFQVEINQLDRIVNEVESITNRLSITLIICALLVFSGLSLSIVFPPTIPHFFSISLVSWLGLILTFLLCMILLIMTVRRKNR